MRQGGVSGWCLDEASCTDLSWVIGQAWLGCLLQFGFEVAPKSLRDFGGIDSVDGLEQSSRWDAREIDWPEAVNLLGRSG